MIITSRATQASSSGASWTCGIVAELSEHSPQGSRREKKTEDKCAYSMFFLEIPSTGTPNLRRGCV